jgi:hypothetical protein
MMNNVFKWRLTCSTHGTVYNYNEDDITAPKCPHVDTDTITDSVIVDSITKEIIGTEILVGKSSNKLKLRGTIHTCAKNSSTTWTYDINENFYIKDGALVTEKSIIGDSVDVKLYDQNDVFMYSYIENYPICKTGITGFVDQTLSDTNFNGMRLKITYHSTGTTDDVICGLQLNGQN